MPIKTRRHKRAEAQANLDTPEPTADPSADSSPEDYDDDNDPDYSPGSEADSGTDITPASRSAAAGRPSRAGKGHRRNWSSTSICNESNPVIITRFNSWKSRLRSLIAEAKAEGIDGYDEVQSVTVAAAESLAIVESVDEYKKKAENAQKDVKTEAGARVTIDQWLLVANRFFKANRTFALTVWTELCLSSASDQPVYIEEGDKTTFLTGVFDYGVGSMRHADTRLVKEQAMSIAEVTQTKQTVAIFGPYRITFVIIEAKNDRENLKKHIPQVVLQCVAFGKDWTKDQSDIVAFCLANSKLWIFGLVDRASKRAYHTDEIFSLRYLL
ncbi:hypothetical protein PTI98_000271 [Pleurotus ostreatus]|nr:hypothetical protein PTI98_000271 [Pleurotus ostreatus]